MHSDEVPLVAIVLGAPLTRQNLNRIGIPILMKRYRVAVLNCMPLLDRPTPKNAVLEKTNFPVVEISKVSDLKEWVKNNNPTVALDFIGQTKLTHKVVRIFGNQKCYFVIQRTGPVPPAAEHGADNRKQLDYSTSRAWKYGILPTNLAYSLFLRIKNKLRHEYQIYRLRRNPLIVSFVAGEAPMDAYVSSGKKFISIASYDYHRFHTFGTYSEIHDSDYFVFLDTALVGAHDWELLGLQSPVDDSTYFAELDCFFSRVEKKYQKKVVVAAHPNLEGMIGLNHLFRGRDVYFDKTPNLIANCQGVIAHDSTALSFAVLAKKPVSLIYNDSIAKSHFFTRVKGMQLALGCPMLNIVELKKEVNLNDSIDIEKYLEYERLYLKSSICNELAQWEKLMDWVHSIS